MLHPLLGLLTAGVLLLTLRRGQFVVASLTPQRPMPARPAHWPSVDLLIPARNEVAVIQALLGCLTRLRYPSELLGLVLISDGSSDGTAEAFEHWASGKRGVTVLTLEACGKAAALNTALAGSRGDLVMVLDADLEPEPDWLQELVRPFSDRRIGAAAALLQPANAGSNIISRYAALNAWVHQLITSAARDRLGLNPPTLGAAAYRRSALIEAGGFAPIPLGEDVATSNALVQRGWSTRFVPSAIARTLVVDRLPDFWNQLVRWGWATRGGAHRTSADSRRNWRQRLEDAAAATGYADRLIFAMALLGAVVGVVPPWLPTLYLLAPALAIAAALHKSGSWRALPEILMAVVCLFPVDAAAAAMALARQLLGRTPVWRSPARTTPDAAVG